MSRQNENVIFTCKELINACKGAVESGAGLQSVFSIAQTPRSGPQGCKYQDLYASVPGKTGRLIVKVVKEKHVGQIVPLDEAELAKLNASRGDKYGVMNKVRDRNPTLNVQKYKVYVKTDDSGAPIGELPGAEQVSDYFQVVAFVDEFFYETMNRLIAEKKVMVHNPRNKDTPSNSVFVPSTKIVPMFQSQVSATSNKNPGMELVNPISRIDMKFDPKTGLPSKTAFFDYTTEYRDEVTKKKAFEPLLFDGQPVTASNIHMLASNSTFSGIVNMNAICYSNMGISIPTRLEIVIVEPPPVRSIDVSDVFGDSDDDDSSSANKATPAMNAEEVDSMVSGLGLDDE